MNSGIITIDDGLPTEKEFLMRFQYGYGSFYEQEAERLLTEFNIISGKHSQRLSAYCRDNNIILRSNKVENCLKRDVMAVVKGYDSRLLNPCKFPQT